MQNKNLTGKKNHYRTKRAGKIVYVDRRTGLVTDKNGKLIKGGVNAYPDTNKP